MAGDVPARTVGDAIHAYPTVSETVGGAFAQACRGTRPLRHTPSHEVRCVQLGDLPRGVLVEPERAQAPHPMPVHRVVELPDRAHGVGQRAGSKTACRKHHQRLLDVRRRAGGLRQERRPLFDRPRAARRPDRGRWPGSAGRVRRRTPRAAPRPSGPVARCRRSRDRARTAPRTRGSPGTRPPRAPTTGTRPVRSPPVRATTSTTPG